MSVKTVFPRDIKGIANVLDFTIGFQDLEKVLNLAKCTVVLKKVWKM